ncbi:MAG: hypothetical protein QM640_00935 [Niabella sp.]
MNTSSTAIRHKLYDYIRVADSKRLRAIYNLLESEIEQTNEWWKDKQFVAELDNRYQALEIGVDTGFTTAQLIESIDKFRIKKYGK